MQGKAVIVVWGWMEYVDIFDLKRRTAFQYLCNAETLKSGPIFKPMHEGNEDASQKGTIASLLARPRGSLQTDENAADLGHCRLGR